jgi:hypothetical protein
MKKIITGLAALSLVASFAFFSTVDAAPQTTAPGQNKIQCFDGPSDGTDYGGQCTLAGKGARGPATLNNTGEDPDGSYSGLYIETANLAGTQLEDVKKLQFSYTGTATAGAPRFSIEINPDGQEGSDTIYAFVSAYYCNNGAGLVDVINDPTCTIYYGSESYPNWAAFVAAYPDATIADSDYPVFIIADEVGSWTISGVKIGR